MAKRKAAARATKKTARRTKPARIAKPKKAASARKAGTSAAKKAVKRAAKKAPRKAQKKAAKAVKRAARKVVRKAAARKPARKPVAAKKAAARKVAPRKTVQKKAAPKKTAPRHAAPKPVAKKPVQKAPAAVKPAVAKAPARAAVAKASRKVPALDRERRTVTDEDALPSPPSSLDLDRTASAARSGRHEAAAHRKEITNVGPDITAGDVDANWESAYSTGDEAPGGDNPTPDQDVVDEIGQALGMEYADDEELGGEGKLAERDDDRWELDPESSEDFDERD